MNKQNGASTIHVDLIRVVAISAVLLLHVNDLITQSVNDIGVLHWLIVVDIYSIISRMGVPFFIMLSGALLLGSSKKDEDISTFFKKRFTRIGIPFLFWGAVFFLWTFYVETQFATQNFIINGVLRGPYPTFWYLYMLFGLYLITPLLRIMLAHFTDKLYKYFTCLWLIGLVLSPLIEFVSGWQIYFDGIVFLIPLCVGYFVIGAYLVKIQIRRWILAVLTVSGFALTALATFLVDGGSGGDAVFFFQGNSSPTMILATLSLFMLLNSYAKPQNISQIEKPSWAHRIMHVISENTLPIYLMHMIIVYLLAHGFFGFVLTGRTFDPILSVPLAAAVTLTICLIIIVPLKKIPGLRKLIG
ncbi:MAG: acyltransferase [Candidatus Bathyarchaeota archaeon]|nr:acyltransferase [Candidatus Termiticorpusculum sp.]